jgi:predicted site-specific integrase-resolvase
LQDRCVIVINENSTPDDDLMKDLVSIITSFCCRLYGMRKGLNKTKQLKKTINKI